MVGAPRMGRKKGTGERRPPWVEGCSPRSGHPDTGAGVNVLGWVGRDRVSPALGKLGCGLPTWGRRPVSTSGLTRVSVASLLQGGQAVGQEVS